MPDDLSNPDPKPRRLTLRRVLLALVLGLAAWCGVGWCLSPRPLYTLRFHVGEGRNGRYDEEFHATLYHSQALKVTLPHTPGPGRVTLHAFDLPTGRLLTSHEYAMG